MRGWDRRWAFLEQVPMRTWTASSRGAQRSWEGSMDRLVREGPSEGVRWRHKLQGRRRRTVLRLGRLFKSVLNPSIRAKVSHMWGGWHWVSSGSQASLPLGPHRATYLLWKVFKNKESSTYHRIKSGELLMMDVLQGQDCKVHEPITVIFFPICSWTGILHRRDQHQQCSWGRLIWDHFSHRLAVLCSPEMGMPAHFLPFPRLCLGTHFLPGCLCNQRRVTHFFLHLTEWSLFLPCTSHLPCDLRKRTFSPTRALFLCQQNKDILVDPFQTLRAGEAVCFHKNKNWTKLKKTKQKNPKLN